MSLSNAVSVDCERDLVSLARNGDRGAFSCLAEMYRERLYRMARKITNSDEDAEDVTQQAFLNAWRGIGGFRGDSSFYTWLVRIMLNEGLGHLRWRKRNTAVELGDGEEPIEPEDPEKIYRRCELRSLIEREVAALPTIYRSVFLMCEMEGIGTDEAAALLGVSVHAVRARLIRARLKLRKRLEKSLCRGSSKLMRRQHGGA